MVLKLKVCKARDSEGVRCNAKFEPRSPWQTACSELCAVNIIAEKKAKDEVKKARKQRQDRRAGLIAIKSRADYMKDAQQAFNAWIRERDKDEPCISCQRHHTGQYHAGHYRTTKAAPELRFNSDNVHKQCSVCNNHLSGNITEYRINLVLRIGVEKVEWLEGNHPARHYSIEELKEITKTYRKKLKELKND